VVRPKGEMEALDYPERATRREFAEELWPSASIGRLHELGGGPTARR
jgi:predicted NUDIX family NTP pyrophosphohydrolase